MQMIEKKRSKKLVKKALKDPEVRELVKKNRNAPERYVLQKLINFLLNFLFPAFLNHSSDMHFFIKKANELVIKNYNFHPFCFDQSRLAVLIFYIKSVLVQMSSHEFKE